MITAIAIMSTAVATATMIATVATIELWACIHTQNKRIRELEAERTDLMTIAAATAEKNTPAEVTP